MQVREAGVWYAGALESWQRDDAGWRALVRYTIDVGMRRLLWVDADEVRPVS
jgi:hypothetical protein